MRWIVAVFLAFILVQIAGWVVELRLIDDADTWVAHTLEAKGQLIGVLSTMQDAEIGQRGYLLTGRDEDLAPYAQSLSRIQNQLQALTGDHPARQESLRELRSLTSAKLDELRQIINVRRIEGSDAAVAKVRAEIAQGGLSAIRSQVQKMLDDEDRLLRQSRANLGRLDRIKIGIEFAAFALLGTFAVLLVLQRLRVAARREELIAQLTEANAELEEFSYRASHDLRAPLGSATKLVEVADRSLLNNLQDRAITSTGLALSSLRQLDDLLEDILRVGQSTHRSEPSQPTDIGQLVDDTIHQMRHLEGFENVSIERDIDLRRDVLVQHHRLQLVLENLLANAIKYRDPAEPHPFVSIRAREHDRQLILEVEDNGLRIPESSHDQLFHMFKRFHPRAPAGSGLGLYFVRKSVRLMNGEVIYRDTGDGSSFTLRLSLDHPEGRAP